MAGVPLFMNTNKHTVAEHHFRVYEIRQVFSYNNFILDCGEWTKMAKFGFSSLIHYIKIKSIFAVCWYAKFQSGPYNWFN